jgi:hypothetical protein
MLVGFLLGLDLFVEWAGPVVLTWTGFFLALPWAQIEFCISFILFSSFGPFVMCFHICSAKQVNSPKLWKWLALSSYPVLFLVNFIRMLAG